MGLRWFDIDRDRGLLVFHDTKNGDTRIVPLAAEIITLLGQHQKSGRCASHLVFASRSDCNKPVAFEAGFAPP
jgi:integrase